MFKKPTILYVEDDVDIRNQLSKFLNYYASKLWTAEDGAVGLKLFKKHSPDIIVSDIKMPNMNGIEMAKEIKKIKIKQHIVFTTAHSESSFFMEAIEAHVDGYILKPIDLELLESKLDDICEQLDTKDKLIKQYLISNEIAKLQNNLLIVLDEFYHPIFLNEKFLCYFGLKDIEEFCQKHISLSTLLIPENDFFSPTTNDTKHCLEELENLKSDERIVSILNYKVNRSEAFLVSITNVKESGHTIITLSEITSLTLLKKNLEKKAYTDELTKVPNRAYFEEQFILEVQASKEEGQTFAIIILDIDKFKDFNDTYGHLVGDEILKELASIVKTQTRVGDTFARWGGEEFVKLLPNVDLTKAKKIAENLRNSIDKNIFTQGLRLSCSFGVAEFQEDDTKESILKRADNALYKAKENGRNRVEG
ncbi:MAG: diguanylate cyclase [Sulfurimonas sp.]|nr:diguanylate cyclase [Sulfurimonas sp.]